MTNTSYRNDGHLLCPSVTVTGVEMFCCNDVQLTESLRVVADHAAVPDMLGTLIENVFGTQVWGGQRKESIE